MENLSEPVWEPKFQMMFKHQIKFMELLALYGKYGIPCTEVGRLCQIHMIRAEYVIMLLNKPNAVIARGGRIVDPHKYEDGIS